MKKLIMIFLFIFSIPCFSDSRGWDLSSFEKIPLQHGGRFKPFKAFAKETVLLVTGKTKWEGMPPAETLLSWISEPEVWTQKEIIFLRDPEVKRQLVLDEKKNYFTPSELLSNGPFSQYANLSSQVPTEKDKGIVSADQDEGRERELKKLVQRVMMFQAIVSGVGLRVIPSSGTEPWMTLMESQDPHSMIQKGYANVIRAYYQNQKDEFEKSSKELRELVDQKVEELYPEEHSTGQIHAEYYYIKYRPFLWAWIFYLFGGFFWSFVRLSKTDLSKKLRVIAHFFVISGFLLHTVGFVIRCYVAGRPPVSNMYESVVWVAWGVLVFAFILYRIQKQPILLSVGSFLGFFGLVAADAAPTVMDPTIQPLVPVLRSNFWLITHVLTITLGYSAFALALGISNFTLFQTMKRKKVEQFEKRVIGLNLLTYRAVQFGVTLLAAGTILGGVWADYSWGRFWGWDPKEVWALIALLGYVILLHGRYAGYLDQFTFPVWTILAFLLVVIAWYGVNFVLGVGLHSYGFSRGGYSTVMTMTLIQVFYVVLAVLMKKSQNHKTVQ